MQPLQVVTLGRTDYRRCWDLQRRVFDLRPCKAIPDTLLLTEHEHVYTIGRSGNANHLLAQNEEMKASGIALYFNDRGGDITYHGPGQLVGYPILDLHSHYLDLHRYLRDLEEVIIRTLRSYGIEGKRDPGYTGVWVGGDKICAIGIKANRWITMHGFALNVSTDLSLFGRIIPCGIFEKGVTSLHEHLAAPPPMSDVLDRVVGEFGRVFGSTIIHRTLDELLMDDRPDRGDNNPVLPVLPYMNDEVQ